MLGWCHSDNSMNRSLLNKLLPCSLALGVGVAAGVYADDWYSNALADIPAPHATITQNQRMSMREAILLALRNNPNVEAAELTRVQNKFSLMVAYNNFFPQYTLNASSTMNNGSSATYNVTPGISLKTPIGTSVTSTYENDFDGSPGQTSVTISQPLLRGFGFLYNTFSLQNAKDDELINQLEYKNAIITAVDTVIKNYRSVVEDYNNYDIQKQTLKQNELQYQQNLVRVKAGTMSESDLVEAKATLATFRLSVVQTENSLEQDKKVLLTDLGLAPTVQYRIDRNIELPPKYKVPTVNYMIAEALAGNIDYQKALINLRKAERRLKYDKLDLLPTLNMQVSNTWGYTGTPTSDSSPNFSFNLSVPINDFDTKGKILSDRIDLINQKNQLAQTKRTLVSNVTQQVENIENQMQQVWIAEQQVALQKKTVQNTQLKIKYGKSAMFELTTQQNTLLTNQTSLVSAKISLLNMITDLNANIATTLKVWGIKLKY